MLAIRPNPYPKAPTHPCTPKVLRAKYRTPTRCPFIVFTFGLEVESIQELNMSMSLSVCQFGCFWFFNHLLRWFLMVPPKDGFAPNPLHFITQFIVNHF